MYTRVHRSLLKGSQTDDLYNGSEFSLDEESDSTVARKRRKTFPDFFTWGNGVNLAGNFVGFAYDLYRYI